MKDKLKSRIATGVVVLATLVLAGVAVFTAMRLYKLRSEPVAPTAPSSSSASTQDEVISCEELVFSITETSPTPTTTVTQTVTPTNTPTATATLTPTNTPTPTPTATSIPSHTPTPTDRPLGGNSPTPTNQPTNTPTPTDTQATPTPTEILIADSGDQAGTADETAQLPAAGISFPTLVIISLGALLILFAFILAF